MRIVALALLPLVVACGSDPKPPPEAPPAAETKPAPQPATQTDTNSKPGDDPSKSNIRIADEIKKACGLSDSEAFFAYDSAAVRDQDKAVLKKLADCFMTGPLKGRQMKLVGHADQRGEEEYNMLLGGRRADNVKSAISGAGMDGAKINTTSRGEMDATGTDEAGWSQDRRVDVMLGQ